jgi:hypothetical protein
MFHVNILVPYDHASVTYFDFPPVEDAACGEAYKNKFISASSFKGFLAILACET